MRRTLPLLLAAVVAVLVAAGCGSNGGSSSSTGGAGSQAATGGGTAGGSGPVVVEMKSIQFSPKEVTVKPGQTIRWENLDTVDHDVKADSGASFASDSFGRGGTFEYTPDKAGTIQYECTLHPGMVGTIQVR